MYVYAVTNQKGGTGKSTTAGALLNGFTARGLKTLAIELDAQGDLAYSLNAESSKKTALSLLTGEAEAEEVITHTENGDIIPSSELLAGADAFIIGAHKEYRLKEALEPLKDKYDYVIIDTPPALGILTVNALTACNSVIIPAQAEIFSLKGVRQLAKTIDTIRKHSNPELAIAGLLLTRYNAQTVLSKEVNGLMQTLAEQLGTKVFKAAIREAICIKEAQISQKSLFEYAPRAKATQDYKQFIEEILQDREGKQ
jgi:chromosome partitioning protein